MCGRYYIADDDRLAELVHRLSETLGEPLSTGEIHPGDRAPVYVGANRLSLTALKWGFDIGRDRPLINARSETVAEKSLFSPLLRDNRVFIPASSYFEWDGEKRRHTLGMGGGFYMAGLYRPNDGSFVILTREAAEGIRYIHNRMPVIFSKNTALEWIKRENDPLRVLLDAQTETVKEVVL